MSKMRAAVKTPLQLEPRLPTRLGRYQSWDSNNLHDYAKPGVSGTVHVVVVHVTVARCMS